MRWPCNVLIDPFEASARTSVGYAQSVGVEPAASHDLERRPTGGGIEPARHCRVPIVEGIDAGGVPVIVLVLGVCAEQ